MAESKKDGTAQNLIASIAPLLPTALRTLTAYMETDTADRAARDRAKLALQIVNTSITLQRAKWTQERHLAGVARTLADGDLDALQAYVSRETDFPMIRERVTPKP